jgi:dihydroflavonol-4-reductase
MTTILVAGATGKVGSAIARAASAEGHDVRAFVRDRARAEELLPSSVELVQGSCLDPAAMRRAVAEREWVFNALGMPQQWTRRPEVFHEVNVEAACKLAEAAREGGAIRFIHTSTADVFAPGPGRLAREDRLADELTDPYERSKQCAEAELLGRAEDPLEIVIANPVGVYSGSPPLGSLELQLLAPIARGRLPLIPPGGMSLVSADGVARGQLLMASRGRPGERYIFSDGHLTTSAIAHLVTHAAGRTRAPRAIPATVARTVAALGEPLARMVRATPPLTRGELGYLLRGARPDPAKAIAELGWTPAALEEALAEVIPKLLDPAPSPASLSPA